MARSFEVKLNTGPITQAVERAFGQANEIFGRDAAREITDDKWNWPRDPSPRDIVDQGGLRNSYVPLGISPREYEHAWTVDYAMAVHEGAQRGSTALPARPWTDRPLELLPKRFETLARKGLGDVK
jgi:hypothetical protein